ncbi:MAG: hypothetical protein U1D30_20840 [Planctomycetota bacterium]
MKKRAYWKSCWITLITCSFPASAEESRLQLQVSPASRPTPVMKYRFYPSVLDQRRGNAAALYYRALVQMENLRITTEDHNKIGAWLELPRGELPKEEVRQVMNRFSSVFQEAEIGARRTRAEWDIPLTEGGAGTILPEIQAMRGLARLFAIRARLELQEGNFVKASQSLQCVFTMSRHVSESGTLISSLVGIACAQLATSVVEEWIATPHSPNLYWALTGLPDPLVDISIGMRAELYWLVPSIPFADVLDKTTLSVEQGRELANSLVEMFRMYGTNESELSSKAGLMALVLSAYPAAKRELIASGRKVSEVEAMPVIQVVLLTNLETYRNYMEEVVAWSGRPYWETQSAARELDRRGEEIAQNPSGYLVRLLAPATNAAFGAGARLQRRFAMLRTAEAIRLFAADNDALLPANLSEIQQVPVPLDPVMNKPFGYGLQGNKGVLEAPEVNSFLGKSIYEITVRPTKK